MTDCLSSFEQICFTPIPIAYSAHIYQILVIFLLLLPPVNVKLLGWFTILYMFLSAFTFFGILAITGEIENPFGGERHDLNIDEFCVEMMEDLEMIMATGVAT